MLKRAPVIGAVLAAALLGPACAAAPAFSATPATAFEKAGAKGADAAAGTAPTVGVYAAGGGTLTNGADLSLTVTIANPGDAPVMSGSVTVTVTKRPLASAAALAAFEAHPHDVDARALGAASTTPVLSGATAAIATVTVPAASVGLSAAAPGVFGLTATVATAGAPQLLGTGTLTVAAEHPDEIGVAAVMPLTVPPRADGLITEQDLADYTGDGGLLTQELEVAQRNPHLTLGIDPMILTSIRALGTRSPASALTWLDTLDKLPNHTFPLQYADADPALQTQTGLAKPLAPTDFGYAMTPADHSTPLEVGETGDATPTTSPGDATGTPTPSPTSGPQLPTLDQLTAWHYDLGGIAWPAPGKARAADLAAFSRAGMPTSIVSGSNTTAASLATTPDAVLRVTGGTALVTNDAVGAAMSAVATAGSGIEADAASSELTAQLALAAQNAQAGGVIVVSTGRIWPTDASRAASAVGDVLDSQFVQWATVRQALTAPATPGLSLVDKSNEASRVASTARLVDLAGEARAGATTSADDIAAFSTALQTPALLTGDVRARLLSLMSVGWATDSSAADWATASAKQLSSMESTLSAVQISAPESIRQASHQALIPITVTNKLPYPVNVVLRATPSSARLDVASDTEKTIAAGSSAKILVDVKAQLSNGTVWLGLQLFSPTGVRIGDPTGASIEVHADWEGIGALVFGLIVIGFFGFGLVRTVQRRRREKAARAAGDGGAAADDEADAAAADAPATAPANEEPSGD